MEQNQESCIEDLLYEGLEEAGKKGEFTKRKTYFDEKVFSTVISDTFNGLINWTKDLREKDRYKAQIKVTNAAGREVTIPVLFHCEIMPISRVKMGYLRLGDEKGPCRNTFCEGVKDLAKNYFGINDI